MNSHLHIVQLHELFEDKTLPINSTKSKIRCEIFHRDQIMQQLSTPIFMNTTNTFLVLSGTATININHTDYKIKNNYLLLISSLHLFQFIQCSSDFKCLCLFISKEFMDEMDPTEMIYVRTKYGIELYNTPSIEIDNLTALQIQKRMIAISEAIENTMHFYYKSMILNAVIALFLETSNYVEQHHVAERNTGKAAHYENIVKQFIELLIKNYRKEHCIDFYASKLNISAHYLTLIVKRTTKQTAVDFIFEMIYSDARSLLKQSRLSVQEIATILNFSDQSSFGKFFKRHAGISPISFRKKQN